MEDHAKLERVLKMLLLLNCRYGRSIEQIAAALKTTGRTVYRYIETIRRVGYVVDKFSDQGKIYYHINKDKSVYKDISNLLFFSEEEAYILSKAIHSIDNENVFKNKLVKKLYSLYDDDRIAAPIIKKEYSDVIHHLCSAMTKKEQVMLVNYKSSNSKKIRDRVVEPFGFTVNFIAIWCYDAEDKSNKLFKTARVDKVEPLGVCWKYENLHQKGNVDIFRVSSYKTIPVTLKLSLPAYNLLIEEYPLAEKYITMQPDGGYLLQTEVAGLDGVGRFVMGLLDEIEVIEPMALKEYIWKKIEKQTSPGMINHDGMDGV